MALAPAPGAAPVALPAECVLGQYTTLFRPRLTGPLDVVAVQFAPGACAALLGLDMAPLTNQWQPLGQSQPRLAAVLVAAAATPHPTVVLDEELGRLAAGRQPPTALAAVVADIFAHTGQLSVAELGARHHLTERTLLRWFRHEVELGPKQFSRIVRFNHARQLLEAAPEARWPAVLDAYGHFDQAHFLREFGEFSGVRPGQLPASFSLTRYHLRGLAAL